MAKPPTVSTASTAEEKKEDGCDSRKRISIDSSHDNEQDITTSTSPLEEARRKKTHLAAAEDENPQVTSYSSSPSSSSLVGDKDDNNKARKTMIEGGEDASEKEILQILTDRIWRDDVTNIQVTLNRLDDLLEEDSSSSSGDGGMDINTAHNHYRKNSQMAYKNGAPMAICQTMKRFPNEEEIQRSCIGLFINMTYHLSFGPDATNICHDFIKQGALRLCLHAMDKFATANSTSSSSLLIRSCCLLGNVMKNQDLARQVIDQGGLRAVLAAMKEHPNNGLLQQYGCFALHRFLIYSSSSSSSTGSSADKNNHGTKIVEAGGIQLIVDAMTNHMDDKTTLVRACNVFRILARESGAHRKQILNAKGLVAIANAITVHLDDNRVVDAAINVTCLLLPGISQQQQQRSTREI